MTRRLWYLRLVCCGRDDGLQIFDSYRDADDFRESYTSGPGVDPAGYSGTPSVGHQRAAILRSVATAEEPDRG